MSVHSSFFWFVIVAGGLALYSHAAQAQTKAFPEAEGFGAFVTGGRGGTVYHVTNLNDSGAGSLRDAISQPNRIIVFDTCGVIYSNPANPLAFSNNITLAGQTAPGDGITIYGNYVSLSNRNNIILRDIRIRPGVNTASDKKGLNITTGHDIIVDHCSIEWARYDNVGITSNSYNITMQSCMIAEPIQSQYSNCLVDSSRSITLIDNLWIDAKTRNPKTKGDLQYINNVVYNWGATEALSGGHSSANWYEDIINNYFIKGPSSSNTIAGEFSSTDMVYQTGNMKDTDKNGTLNGVAMTTADFSTPTFTSTPYNNPTVAVTTDTATNAYYRVVASAGATPQNRDPVDTRLINQVLSLGTSGAVITDETVVGGQPAMTVVTRPAGFDTDNDGMPDAWETAHGLNPNNATDRNLLNPVGYTMVEQYINELGAIHGAQTWHGSSGNWLTPAFWTSALPTNDDNVYIRSSGPDTNVTVTVTGNLAACFSLYIGGNGAPAGEKVTVSGSLPVGDSIYMGYENNGTLEINTGGTVRAWNVVLGNTIGDTTYAGTLALNGGTLQTNQVVLGGGSPGNWTSGGSVNWSGGTLQAIGATKFAVPAVIGAGGARIDSNGFSCTVSGVLGGEGGLTKTGSGSVVLSAVNSYSGPTVVSSGVLELASTGQIDPASAISTSATTATFQVDAGTHTVGNISGTGTTVLMPGASLIASSVVQGVLTLGAGSTLTIAPLPGGPLAGSAAPAAVPEPSTIALLIAAALGIWRYGKRLR
jgi:autotransporter-associated beta strand protein